MAEAKAVITSISENARAHLVTGDAETTLCNKPIPARRRRIDWDGSDQVATGTYSRRYVCRRCKAQATGEKKQGSPRFTKAQAIALHERASAAAKAAAEAATPIPMVVGTPKDPMASLMGGDGGGFDTSKPIYRVNDGGCGMAWVVITPGNCSYARHLKLRKHYYGGAEVWRPGYNGQSYERGTAAARAYAEVLHEAGITAYAGSRED